MSIDSQVGIMDNLGQMIKNKFEKPRQNETETELYLSQLKNRLDLLNNRRNQSLV